jgi:flavin-binding protein dodecin
MTESAYKVIELIGTSAESWEKAAQAAVDRAGKSLRDLRIARLSSSTRNSLPRQAERLVQLQGLGRVLIRRCVRLNGRARWLTRQRSEPSSVDRMW